MHKSNLLCVLLPGAIGLSTCPPAAAGIELYKKENTSVSVDASVNTFFTTSDVDSGITGQDRSQSRVKMGFLPNWIGFDLKRQAGDLSLGGRASFWVSINDSDESPTDGLIDTRQFYATVDASWGQVLLGKDFTLFNRSNIFMDEILLGYGWVNDTIGLVDGGNVSFGNIGSGYLYPLPTSQLTYRSPELAGFKLALGLIDPTRTDNGDDAEESRPRIEAELTYSSSWEGGSLNAWVGGLQQASKSSASKVDSTGISYGARLKFRGLALHASGYTGEGIGWLIGPADGRGLGLGGLIVENGREVDSDGWLAQASYSFHCERMVLSYGRSTIDNSDEWTSETTTGAWFHSFNDHFLGVLEYNRNELEIGGKVEEVDTLALGLIVNF
ncbi:MAG: porin [Parahaliea sp.]